MKNFEGPKSPETREKDPIDFILIQSLDRAISLTREDIHRLKIAIQEGFEFDPQYSRLEKEAKELDLEGGFESQALGTIEENAAVFEADLNDRKKISNLWPKFIEAAANWNPELDLNPKIREVLEEAISEDPSIGATLADQLSRAIADLVGGYDIGRKEQGYRVERPFNKKELAKTMFTIIKAAGLLLNSRVFSEVTLPEDQELPLEKERQFLEHDLSEMRKKWQEEFGG